MEIFTSHPVLMLKKHFIPLDLKTLLSRFPFIHGYPAFTPFQNFPKTPLNHDLCDKML